MDFYQINSQLYTLLLDACKSIQSIAVIDDTVENLEIYPRLEESKYIVSKDVQRTVGSVVTAHKLEQYRPEGLKIDRLMRESDDLIIEYLIREIGGVRGVPFQSNT